MIVNHFGLVRRPFDKDISTANLYLTEQHRKVLRRLEQIAAHCAHASLTGEVGVGKSTLLRAFKERLSPSRHFCHYVGNDLPSRGILRAVSRGFGLSPYWLRADLIDQVQQAVAEQFEKAGRRTLLIVDEGHRGSCLPVLRLSCCFWSSSGIPLSGNSQVQKDHGGDLLSRPAGSHITIGDTTPSWLPILGVNRKLINV
ncbi:MAG TPA: hypothetical protein DD435_08800 [Cyanobacteria bacterium UBA8530]|nr:hypothetical protein [Cyanobacteria bacterium UBA8530]